MTREKMIFFCSKYLPFVSVVVMMLYISTRSSELTRITFLYSIAITILIVYAISHFIKWIIHKDRPKKSSELFVPFDIYAFPSEHASLLFALATMVFLYHPYGGIVMYLIACIVSFARVKAKVHYFPDVIGGAIIGVLLSLYLFPQLESIVFTSVIVNSCGLI